MKQFTFFIFAGRGGISAFKFVRIIIEVFYFHFPLPTTKIAKLKVTVKLTGSMVYNNMLIHLKIN